MIGQAGLAAPVARKRLTSGASAISTGTDFFPSLRPAIKSGRLYRFWYLLAFTKDTAGTVTFQLKNSAGVNFTSISATMVLTRAATALAAVGNVLNANAAGATTATFPATVSLTAAGYIAIVQGIVIPASDTRLSIAPSAYGAGTISTAVGSVQIVEDFGPSGTDLGDFA
jgi:hypothetical protein